MKTTGFFHVSAPQFPMEHPLPTAFLLTGSLSLQAATPPHLPYPDQAPERLEKSDLQGFRAAPSATASSALDGKLVSSIMNSIARITWTAFVVVLSLSPLAAYADVPASGQWGYMGNPNAAIPDDVALPALTSVTAIAAGGEHSVALKQDGTVVAWGRNEYGQTTVPTAAQSGITAIAAGAEHTVALKSNGSVLAWGWNNYGQSTVPVGAQSGVTSIAVGSYHNAVLKQDGSVVAWGLNTRGQTTVPASAQSGVTAIAAGGSNTVALKQDGSVVVWGWDQYGQTTVPAAAQSGVIAIAAGGGHIVALKQDGSVVAWGRNDYGQAWNSPAAAQLGVVAIAAGGSYTLVLKQDGSVVARGRNDHGQTTIPAAAQSGVTAIAAGGAHNLVLKQDSSVAAWGGNWAGESVVPATVQSSVTAIAASDRHTVALKQNGSVLAWGLNDRGQTTVPAGALSGVTAIAAGFSHTVVLKQDGSVLAWGSNFYDQTAVPHEAQTGVIALATRANYTMALTQGGAVVAWGRNDYGQTSVPAAAQSGVTAIAAGSNFSVALKQDGSVVAWGDNSLGQATVPATAQSGVTAIAAGSFHAVALKQDGSVIAWGNNSAGERTVPAAAQSGVTAIAAGSRHTVALKQDGSVVAWGWNHYGQTAVPVAAQSGVTAIEAGGGVTFFRVGTAPVDSLTVEFAGGGALDPAGVDFGTVGQGGYRERYLRLRNDGAEPIAISAVSVSGMDAGDFLASPSFFMIPDPFVLAPGAQQDVQVRFQPQGVVEGPRQGLLSIMEGGLAPVEIPLLGNVEGLAQAQPVFRYRVIGQGDDYILLGDGDTVDFGTVGVSETGFIEFEIENLATADADMPIQSMFEMTQLNGVVRTVDGFAGFPGFTGIAGYNPGSLAPGQAFGFTLVFEPNERGPMEASHVFQIPAADGSFTSFTTHLTGTGAAGELTVIFPDGQDYDGGLGFLDFGVVAIGDQVQRFFTLRNDGDADLSVSGVDFRDEGIGSMSGLNHVIGRSPDDPLAPGESMTLEVSYWPLAQLSLEGVVMEILHDEPNAPPFRILVQGSSAPAEQVMEDFLGDSGLSGDEALPDAIPFDDGVPNLLKYAFNMNLAGPDSGTLTPDSGTSGLPTYALDDSGPETVVRVQYIRRTGSGLVYTPLKSGDLLTETFEPMNGTETTETLDGGFERVTVTAPCDPATEPTCFWRVRVTLP